MRSLKNEMKDNYIQTTATETLLQAMSGCLAGMERTLLDVALVTARDVLRLTKPPENFDPDPYSTEMPFLTDNWPRK